MWIIKKKKKNDWNNPTIVTRHLFEEVKNHDVIPSCNKLRPVVACELRVMNSPTGQLRKCFCWPYEYSFPPHSAVTHSPRTALSVPWIMEITIQQRRMRDIHLLLLRIAGTKSERHVIEWAKMGDREGEWQIAWWKSSLSDSSLWRKEQSSNSTNK